MKLVLDIPTEDVVKIMDTITKLMDTDARPHALEAEVQRLSAGPSK